MELTVLGSGTAIPVHDRFPAGYLLAHDATTLLVDCGPGTLRRFAQAGASLHELDAVFFTHYHTDHCGDLAALMFALRSPTYAGRKPLHLFGAPGLQRLLSLLAEAWPWTLPRGYELRVTEVAPGQTVFGDLGVRALPIRHTAQSLGYRFTALTTGASVAFSGDADECDELVELATGADLFVCDAAFPENLRVEGHLTPRLAGAHAERAKARTLLLTHFYPECEGVDVIGAAQQAFQGRVLAAADLQRLAINAMG